MPTRTSRLSRKMSVKASMEFEQLKGVTVYKAGSGDPVNITDLWQADQGAKVVIPFLTHFADLTSWEYARKIVRNHVFLMYLAKYHAKSSCVTKMLTPHDPNFNQFQHSMP